MLTVRHCGRCPRVLADASLHPMCTQPRGRRQPLPQFSPPGALLYAANRCAMFLAMLDSHHAHHAHLHGRCVYHKLLKIQDSAPWILAAFVRRCPSSCVAMGVMLLVRAASVRYAHTAMCVNLFEWPCRSKLFSLSSVGGIWWLHSIYQLRYMI